MRILLVEDDECIAKTLENVLGNQNYVVDVATDGQVAWELVEAFEYDLILLDVILPKLDGITLCQRLRSNHYQMPVLLLTAQNSSTDKVVGLEAGADDYVVKPFELQELLARIRVLLRRKSSPLLQVLKCGNLCLDPDTCEVTYNGHILHLTPKEYRLLELFLRNRHRVLSRSAILEHLWSVEEAPTEDAVTAHIKGLRQKLKTTGSPTNFIETVYGLGYRLKLPESDPPSPSLLPPQIQESSIQQQTRAAVTLVWERLKGQSSDRIAVLEQATTALLKNTLEPELRQKAKIAAHNLAGSLGTFGFAEGSHLAHEIEQMLPEEVTLDQSEALHLWELLVALQRSLKKTSSMPLDKPMTSRASPVMLLVDDDTELAERIVTQAQTWEIRIELAPNLSEAREAIARQLPDVVLLDLSLINVVEENLTLLAELTNRTPAIPVLFFTADDSLADRIKVARIGARAFLQKPLLPEQVLEAVTRVLKQSETTQAKVMVVDDDPQVLAVLRTLLEPWGLRLTTLDDPLDFWTVLEEFSPDLLVLDVEMPLFNGIELCQVVRNSLHWSSLPVMFLTAHTDASTMQQVFTAGADDFVCKPIIGPELVTRVLNRLERVQMLRSVTKVANTQLNPHT